MVPILETMTVSARDTSTRLSAGAACIMHTRRHRRLPNLLPRSTTGCVFLLLLVVVLLLLQGCCCWCWCWCVLVVDAGCRCVGSSGSLAVSLPPSLPPLPFAMLPAEAKAGSHSGSAPGMSAVVVP